MERRAHGAIELGRSWWVCGATVTLHLGAVIGVLAADVLPMLRAACAAALAAHLVRVLGRDVLRTSSDATVALIPGAGGRWGLRRRDGRLEPAELFGGYVHPALVVARFRTARRRTVAIVVAKDASAPDALRRMRVAVRGAGRRSHGLGEEEID